MRINHLAPPGALLISMIERLYHNPGTASFFQHRKHVSAAGSRNSWCLIGLGPASRCPKKQRSVAGLRHFYASLPNLFCALEVCQSYDDALLMAAICTPQGYPLSGHMAHISPRKLFLSYALVMSNLVSIWLRRINHASK